MTRQLSRDEIRDSMLDLRGTTTGGPSTGVQQSGPLYGKMRTTIDPSN